MKKIATTCFIASLTVSSLALATNPSHFSQLISEAQYQNILQSISADSNSPYTYQSLSEAATRWGAFSNNNDTENLLEIAAFLANVAHETGKLNYTTEVACSDGHGTADNPLPAACSYGGSGNVAYYGRGPIQLSWNYNYDSYNTALHAGTIASTFNDPVPNITTDPDAILSPDLLFDSGVWFWNQHTKDSQTPTISQMFQKDAQTADTYKTTDPFGQSINLINGGIECGQPQGSIGYQEAQDRINLYKTIVTQIAKDHPENQDLQNNLSTYTSDAVGNSCLKPGPAPGPSPAPGPGGLQITYSNNGQWAALSCWTVPATSTYNIGKGQTQTIAQTEPKGNIASVACSTSGGQAAFSYSNGSWVTSTATLASCNNNACTVN